MGGGELMITRIEVDGFKSFADFALDLEAFQVIVGPNGAGKSNLFDALKLLSRLAETDLRTAFQEGRGESGELFTVYPDGTTAPVMTFGVELLLDESTTDSWGRTEELIQTRVRYDLKIRREVNERGLERLRIVSENLLPIRRNSDAWGKAKNQGNWSNVFRYRRTKPFISTSTVEGMPTVVLNQDGRAGRSIKRPLDKLESTLLNILTNAEFPHGFATREEIKSWTFLQLAPEALRAPNSRLAPDKVDSTGRNLPNALARIKKTEEFALNDISTDLANLVPGILAIEVEEDEARDRFVIWARTNDGRRFSSRVLSDGTLRLLALTVVKNDPAHSGVLMFEEPENGVHPSRLTRTASLLRQMTTQFDDPEGETQKLQQLIVNTHSPKLVSELQPSEMVFAHVADLVRGGGQPFRITRMSPVEDKLLSSEGAYTRLQLLEYLETLDPEKPKSFGQESAVHE